jgi:hypothetical protein
MTPADGAGRWKLLASGLFFFGYLAFQTIYPVLGLTRPGYDSFTWHMYAGLGDTYRYTVVFADGTRREAGNPLKVGGPTRFLGSSVDQDRFLPPWLCANWIHAREVIARNAVTGGEHTIPCPSARP